MNKIKNEKDVSHGSIPEVGEKRKEGENNEIILQGLRVAQAAVTERWP